MMSGAVNEGLVEEGFSVNPGSRLFMVVDWSDESTKLIRSVIEARRILLMDYLYDVKVEKIEQRWSTLMYEDTIRPPLLYYNGKLVSQGKALTPEEIVDIVLEEEQGAPNEPKSIDIGRPDDRPLFSPVAMV